MKRIICLIGLVVVCLIVTSCGENVSRPRTHTDDGFEENVIEETIIEETIIEETIIE